LCKFFLPWPKFLFYCICWNACVLKTLPLCWILLVQNLSSFCCIVFLFITVAMCWLLSCLFLFFYLFFSLLCKCFLLLTHVLSFFLSIHWKIMMINLILLHLFWCLTKCFYFFCIIFGWCMHFMQHSLSFLHFVQMHISCVPSIKRSFWVEENKFLKKNCRHIQKTFILIPHIS
jgi:hypothetical protein